MNKPRSTVRFKPLKVTGSRRDGRITSNEIDSVKQEASIKLNTLVLQFTNKVKRWQPALRSFGAAFYFAHERFNKTLKDRAKREKAQQDLLFSALGLVLGSSLNWIGYALKQSESFNNSALKVAIKG